MDDRGVSEASRELRVVELLGQALELESSARQDFLLEACAGDDELREELEALLAEEAALDDGFLSVPAAAEVRPPPSPPKDLSPAPEWLGPYRVIRQLGRGGMGTVYLGEQKEPVRRQVALKIIDAIHDPARRQRFAAECQALARLSHPNVASLYEVGTTEDEHAFVAMELVAGTKITEYCDDHALSIPERIDLFLGACAGVRHAHEKGILHRDIKPSNVLVTEIDGRPTAKVIDFGIARAISEPLIDGPQMTLAHQLIGSPAYMSPEAGSGNRDLDTRTDVYSLGLLLYLLLTGVLPYEADDQEMFGPVLKRLAREPQPTLSARFTALDVETQRDFAAFRRLGRGGMARKLRGDLDAILDQAIALEREERYSSPADLAADLERHRRKVPVSARARTGPYLVGRFLQRRLGLVASLSALILALALGTIARTSEARRANLEAARARSALTEAQEVTRFLVELFEIADPERSRDDPVDARELLDRAAARLRGELQDQPLARARLLHTIGTIYTRMALFEPAETLITEALEVRESELPRDHTDVLASVNQLGVILRRQHRLAEAEVLFRRNLEAREAAPEADPIAIANALNGLGNLLWHQKRYDEAEAIHLRALEIRQRDLPPDHIDIAETSNNLGALLRDQERYQEALPFLRRAAQIFAGALGEQHPKRGAALYNLALIEDSLGEWQVAEIHAHEASEIWTAAYGPAHPRTLSARSRYGSLLRKRGRPQESAKVYHDIAVLKEEASGPGDTRLGSPLIGLGISLGHLGEFEQAEATLQRALEIYRAARGEEHPSTINARSNLAWLAWRRGRLAQAEADHRQVLELRERLLGPESRGTAWTLHYLARTLIDQGRSSEAEPLLQRALAIREAALAEEHPYIGHSLLELGLISYRAGRLDEARRQLRRVVKIYRRSLIPEHVDYQRAIDALTAIDPPAAS